MVPMTNVQGFTAENLMGDPTWTSLTSEEPLHTFPTPPYEAEDIGYGSMNPQSSSSMSPLSSIRDSLDSESLFGELPGVNFADVFIDTSAVKPDVDAVAKEQQIDDDAEILESFVKEVDDLGLDIEFSPHHNPENAIESNVAVNDSPVATFEVAANDSPIPTFEEQETHDDSISIVSVTCSESDDDSDISEARSSPIFHHASVSRGKVAHQIPEDEQPAIRMVKVSQYEQYSVNNHAKPTYPRSSRVHKKPTEPEPCLEQSKRVEKKHGDIDPFNCDIRKVPPSRRAAVQAKINREKKKAYIQSLEEERDAALKENILLSQQTKKLAAEKKQLAEEAAYLRRVLLNESQLAGMLKNIGSTTKVSLSSTIMGNNATVPQGSNKRRASFEDHDYSAKRSKSETTPQEGSGGICLHVDQGNVSVEMCRHCAAKSRGFEVD